MTLLLKSFIVGLFTELWHRVVLSWKSTLFGFGIALITEAFNYTLANVPNPLIHSLAMLLFTIFVAWKDKKVAEGQAKLLILFICFGALGASAQTPSARATHNPEALASAIESDPAAVSPEAPPAVTAPKFGGCLKSGLLCFGPSIAVTGAAINISRGTVEGAFSPGVGYGLTLAPAQWYAFGADAHFIVDPGAQQASAALMFKFANYIRVGISKGFIGDKSLRLPIGFGVDL